MESCVGTMISFYCWKNNKKIENKQTFGGVFCGGHPTSISVDTFCEPELVWVLIGDFPVLGAILYPKQYEISLQLNKKKNAKILNTKIKSSFSILECVKASSNNCFVAYVFNFSENKIKHLNSLVLHENYV